jgi:hypothetical protein
VFVAYPSGFDFTFVYWYLMAFCGKSPFSFSAIDIKTFGMALLDNSFHKSSKRFMPKSWFKGCKKGGEHVALNDARNQGIMFMNMMRENRTMLFLRPGKK